MTKKRSLKLLTLEVKKFPEKLKCVHFV